MTDLTLFDSDELYALAEIDLKNNNHTEALNKSKVLLTRNEVPIEIYALLGRLYATILLFEKAKQSFEVFIKNVPEAIPVRFQLGMVELDMGNTEKALKVWDEVLSDKPNFPPAQYHKALVLSRQNRIQEAVDLLNNLIETASDEDEHIPMAEKLLSNISLQ